MVGGGRGSGVVWSSGGERVGLEERGAGCCALRGGFHVCSQRALHPWTQRLIAITCTAHLPIQSPHQPSAPSPPCFPPTHPHPLTYGLCTPTPPPPPHLSAQARAVSSSTARCSARSALLPTRMRTGGRGWVGGGQGAGVGWGLGVSRHTRDAVQLGRTVGRADAAAAVGCHTRHTPYTQPGCCLLCNQPAIHPPGALPPDLPLAPLPLPHHHQKQLQAPAPLLPPPHPWRRWRCAAAPPPSSAPCPGRRGR